MTAKSCIGCPSYLTASEAEVAFRGNASTGAPMCARFGHVLGKKGLKPIQERKLAESFAEKCESHGAPRPASVPERAEMQVTLGDPRIRPAPADIAARVRSCSGCANFIEPSIVSREMGWPLAMCSAKGHLIQRNRTRVEADGCSYAMPGTPRSDTNGVLLHPMYENAFGMDTDPMAVLLRRLNQPIIEPLEYVSDVPVSAEDEADGIRAWRAVVDPEGYGSPVMLPIFRPDVFSTEERAKIPQTDDDELPGHYADYMGAMYRVAKLWFKYDETPALWGMAGTGKTELFRHIAWLMQVPFDRVSLTGSSDPDDVIGKWIAVAGENGTETKFQYGRLPRRYRLPGVFLLDEANAAPEDIWQTVRPLTDNSKQLVLDQANNERIFRHTYCFLGMAMNPAWDMRNTGVRPLADADGNRLSHIRMELPPEKVERAILTQRCQQVDDWTPEPEKLTLVMQVAADIRRLSEEETIPITWGIRPQIKVLRFLQDFKPITAYRLAVTDNLDPEQAKLVLNVVKSYAGEE